MQMRNHAAAAALLGVTGAAALWADAGPSTAPAHGSAVAVQRLDLPVREFFEKQVDCGGIPIMAAAVVADGALIEAHRRLSLQLRGIPSVHARLARKGAELHIIGKDQVTSDLPELRHYKGKPFDGEQTIDQRTRGVGDLMASCGEENLLRLETDRYRGRDICVHEFAHCIFNHGVPEAVRQAFEAQRVASLETGRWVGAYAGTNSDEFFAELTMWYFGTHGDMNMKGDKPADGAEGLEAYDPAAFALIDRFYSGQFDAAAEPARE